MEIRNAKREDLAAIMEIYEGARRYMRENGNREQWAGGYPPQALIERDIAEGICYVCTEGCELLGVFCYFYGEDPTYLEIEDGAWLNDRPYGVIHRIASATHRKGVASACFDWAFAKCGNLKIDTHRDNIPMQRSLAKNGFARCGIIHLANGDPRIAYQKTETVG